MNAKLARDIATIDRAVEAGIRFLTSDDLALVQAARNGVEDFTPHPTIRPYSAAELADAVDEIAAESSMFLGETAKHDHGYDSTRGAWQCHTCDTAVEDCSAI